MIAADILERRCFVHILQERSADIAAVAAPVAAVAVQSSEGRLQASESARSPELHSVRSFSHWRH